MGEEKSRIKYSVSAHPTTLCPTISSFTNWGEDLFPTSEKAVPIEEQKVFSRVLFFTKSTRPG